MTDPSPPPDRPDRPLADGRVLVWRHPWWVRLTHWLNVLAITVLLMSGINILMAHPHLYWGLVSTFDDPWLSIPRAPDWLMLPPVRDLARGRHWHFFFAWVFVLNGLIYLLALLITRRVRRLWPSRADVRDIPHSIVEHARLRFPHDDRARAYNVLQKLSYLAMVFLILPLMLLTGLAMSPMVNAGSGGLLLDLFGGRQSARTLHFLSAAAIVGFTVVHVALVIWTGPFNNQRAMLTGWFAIRPGRSS